MSTGTVRACERSIGGSDAAGGDGDDVPPPPVERAPGGSVLRASTPWGVLHRSTEHRAVGGNQMARGTPNAGHCGATPAEPSAGSLQPRSRLLGLRHAHETGDAGGSS